MKAILLRAASLILHMLLYSSMGWAQNAATNRNVNLRRDPSTSSPILAHLPAGTRLMLVDVTPDSGFYHVRTEDDEVGWIFARYVTVSPPVSPSPTPVPAPSTPGPVANDCDASINAHVYHPQRLLVKQSCIAVTGTIVDATANQSQKEPDGVRHEADGDTHGWLKLDAGLESLLNAGNLSDEGGNLVFEIVCRFPVTQADAKTACVGYTDRVVLPPVGSHVRLVGRYVQDTFHAQWNEVHPVTSITVIP